MFASATNAVASEAIAAVCEYIHGMIFWRSRCDDVLLCGSIFVPAMAGI